MKLLSNYGTADAGIEPNMIVLVLNCGSSSLKFQLIQTDTDAIAHDTDRQIASGLVERIGSQSLLTLQGGDILPHKLAVPLRDHRIAVDYVMKWLVSPEAKIDLESIGSIEAVGHRVVHGGERFTKAVIIDDEVLRELGNLIELAPLHNPANISGIRAAREVLGRGIPQVAVFDTGFHHTLPEHAYLYAIPYQFYRRYKVRRYGFHGTSHRYVSYRYRKLLDISKEEVYAVTMHLGSGSSACAIAAGASVDTSMGLTPLEGLVMGTRSGDIDPAVLDYIGQKEGMNLGEIDSLLNRSSGLLGISGLTNDMRELLDEEREHDDRRARLAIEIYCYRARKYIGSYLAAIATELRPDTQVGICFTGGIGENSADIRSRIMNGLEWFGLVPDEEANTKAVAGFEGPISKPGRLRAYVIPTNEELVIARDTLRAVLELPEPY
jgi:acetate kinase